MSWRTGPCYLVSYKRMEEKDVVSDKALIASLQLLRSRCFFSYKRMEEKDVMPDRSLLLGLIQKNGGKDVIPDRPLLLGFLQKNGGKGCHSGQDLVEQR